MDKNSFELLLPVGQKEMALAAIHNGADAIYVGFPGFNARGRSYDFELTELKEIIETCHLYGVKVNLAFNIVIFESELPSVVEAIQKVLPLKPDALIIQDLGLAQIVKQMCPEQVVHGSTQMTITNDLAISLLDDLDIKRFVLGRENSISEIKLIAEKTNKDLEVFVHGALCVSYSGQCFTSETIGGRSANRGQCAQSCRFTYDLIVDGEKKNLVDRNYLVSPQDLCGLAEIPELMKLGVKSFKVEGRLKTPEYVATVASSYRKVIDSALKQHNLSPAEIEQEKQKMAVQYSRGFFSGWLHGVNHQELVDGRYSSHRGVEIGRILSYKNAQLDIELTNSSVELKNGDGLLWFEGSEKKGSLIYSVQKNKSHLTVGIANSTPLKPSIVNSLVYLNFDKDLHKSIEKSFTDKNFFKKVPVKFDLHIEMNQPLTAILTDGVHTLSAQTESVVSTAQKKPLSIQHLFEEFSALSATPFSLTEADFKIHSQILDQSFLSHKEIKQLRQKLIAELEQKRKNSKVDKTDTPVVVSNLVTNVHKKIDDPVRTSERPALRLLLRTKEQVTDIIDAFQNNELVADDIESITLDFEFGRDYTNSIELLKKQGLKVGLATTRILKPQEYINLKILHSLKPDFILVRNLGALYYYQNVQPFSGELRGDFSLNVTNHRTFNYLSSKGLKSICLSYDLNFQQSIDLLQQINARSAELTIHQNMPSFHMEHCVFAAFLSQGKSYRDCGKPCEKHKVQLKDQFGNSHWIKPDHECRNTMYNASAQTALPYLNEWMTHGLGAIRFEALHEHGQELVGKLKNYISVLKSEMTIDQAMTQLKTTEAFGLSPRQLARSEEYKPRKKDHSFIS